MITRDPLSKDMNEIADLLWQVDERMRHCAAQHAKETIKTLLAWDEVIREQEEERK